MYKLIVLSDVDFLKENRLYYYDIFEYSKLYVKEIFPETRDWLLYYNGLLDYKDNISTFIPISLFNAISREYSFGILAVEVYRK